MEDRRQTETKDEEKTEEGVLQEERRGIVSGR